MWAYSRPALIHPKDEADRRVPPPQLQIKRADWPETPSVEYNITEN